MRLALARTEHPRGRVVAVHLGRLQHVVTDGARQRREQAGAAGYPVGQRGALQRHALARIHLALPIQRKVIGIFAHQHMGEQAGTGQATLDGPAGRAGLVVRFCSLRWPLGSAPAASCLRTSARRTRASARDTSSG